MDRPPSMSTWSKSTYSGMQENCLEVAVLAGTGRAVRDSKNPGGPVLGVTDDGWRAFVSGIKGYHLA
ncbi:DUF397 domain-containing protein [Sphaerisporangium aureirubrum]|uniref:DUF397 domain-containing protein n=1 Tax=Sphaerisporangium aureirubrum TaxID=1544736 RepID=A0ABW1NJP0_9ACTN